jgi:hypothetical protein
MRKIVMGMLHRAGIQGPRAHPHAFRKGVVTALLKSGNSLQAVSRFVHHKSTQVTERSYDKRTYAEVVEHMIIPLQWERQHEEEAEPASCTQDATTESTTSHNRTAAAALLAEMEENDTLRTQNQILLSLLSPELRQQFDNMIGAS